MLRNKAFSTPPLVTESQAQDPETHIKKAKSLIVRIIDKNCVSLPP